MNVVGKAQNALGGGDTEGDQALGAPSPYGTLGVGDHEENEQLVHRARDRRDLVLKRPRQTSAANAEALRGERQKRRTRAT